MDNFENSNNERREAGDSDPLPKDLAKLIEERKQVDIQLNEQRAVLEEFNVGMNDPLVDKNDFPRNDIPVYEIRHARAKILKLETDFKTLTRIIEQKMSVYYSNYVNPIDDVANRKPKLQAKCFKRLAKCKDIKPDSPAAVAGLKDGDIIIELGNVNGDNYKSLQNIADEVKNNANSYMRLIVEREEKLVRTNLKPRNWAGGGLLGCNVVPLN